MQYKLVDSSRNPLIKFSENNLKFLGKENISDELLKASETPLNEVSKQLTCKQEYVKDADEKLQSI